jgi:hypothetical protein
MKERNIIEYAKQLLGIPHKEVIEFIKLLEYWGEIVYITRASSTSISISQNQINNNLIVLKPSILISLCKQFITAKEIQRGETPYSKA